MRCFLLDTNACIQILRGRSEPLKTRLLQVASSDLAICSIVWAELLMGAHLSPRGYPAERAKLDGFLQLVQFPFDREAAEHYAEIRSHLQPIGQLIGERDLQIAAIARSRDLTVVTHNVREFNRVPKLIIEDWEVA